MFTRKKDLEIVGVACRNGEAVITASRPYRHHNLIKMIDALGDDPAIYEQGFVTRCGEFLDRTQAAKAALSTGQVKSLRVPRELFSEDLW